MTPLRPRAVFYRTLSQMLAAGADVLTSMHSAIALLPRRERRRAGETILPSLAGGQPISVALAASALFPADDLRLLALAEHSGHGDLLLRELADFTDELIALRRVICSGLALPAVYLVIAAFVVPFPAFFTGGSLGSYLISSVGFLLAIAIVVGGAIFAFRHAPGWLLDRILPPLPLLGSTWRELDYWHLTRTLALLARTHVGVIAAVRLAADTCRSPRLAAALRTAAGEAEACGAPLGALLAATRELPPEMIALWQTGEQSGRLDETFQRLATLFGERCRQRLQQLAQWTPRVGYFLVAGYLVWEILHLAGGYLGALNEVTKF
jgi:type II secretory pathway component PulF